MRELISIIVPCYNAEKTIDRCIRSVLNQNYSNWELIVVDDGSKDESGLRTAQWCKSDARIRLIEQENAGVSAARNKALDAARGKYICFLDADDWYSDDFLSSLYDAMQQKKVEIACCGYRVENSSGGHDVLQKGGDNTTSGKDFLKKIFFDTSVRGFVCNKMFLAELLRDKYFPEDAMLSEDLLLLCDIYTKKIRMTYINKPLYHYWVEGTGASQSKNILIAPDGGMQSLNVFRRIADQLPGVEEQKLVARMCGESVVNSVYHYRQQEWYNKKALQKQLHWFHWKYLLSDSLLKKKIQYLISVWLIYRK